MRTAFENEGEIRGTDLLAALVALWREGASGSLQFSRSGATAGFELVNGELTATSSSDPRFETASILVRAGKLEAATLERLAASEGADRALLALQAGILTRREWRWGEKIRAVEILSDLLTWIEGDYWFFRSAEREATESRIPIPRLILELFLRSRDRSLVLHYLGGVDVPLARAERFDAEFATFGLTADAESVVRLIDGTSSAAEISSEAPAEAFAVEKLLAALVTLGLVRPEFVGSEGEPATARGAAATGQPEEGAEPEGEEPGVEEGGEPEEPESAEAAVDAALAQESVTPYAASEVSKGFEAEEPETYEPEDFRRAEPSAEAPMSDARFDGSSSGERSEEDELGAARLTGEDAAGALEGFDQSPREADRFPDAPLDTSTGVGSLERPSQRSGSLFVWMLAVLVVAVAAVLWMRSRGTTTAGGSLSPVTSPTPAAAASATEVGSAAGILPTSVPAVSAAPAVPTAAPAPTRPMAAEAAPTPRPGAGKPAAAPPARVAAAVDSTLPGSRQQWLDRAARDRKRFAGSARSRYAIQLELACEVGSLVDAFRHDRPSGNMWLVTTPFQEKTCFRVLWGHYPTVQAARRALAGAPGFFSTPSNHPAVTAVR